MFRPRDLWWLFRVRNPSPQQDHQSIVPLKSVVGTEFFFHQLVALLCRNRKTGTIFHHNNTNSCFFLALALLDLTALLVIERIGTLEFLLG